MEIKMTQNLHTHTTFCDGRDTPEEMIEEALRLGFDSLGFSGHANTVLSDSCEMRKKIGNYRSEINRLKKKYEGEIKLFLGIELDLFSHSVLEAPEKYDYKIASVHYGKIGEEYFPYDHSAEKAKAAIERHFAGDGIAYAKSYYEHLAKMSDYLDADFVGHFDLVTKFSEREPELFDTGCKEYRNMALESLTAVREKFEFFEVNTGAIGRGYRKTPYPDPFILNEMKVKKCKLLITSDCHNKNFLSVGFEDSVELIRSAGFEEIYHLTDKGFVGKKI